MDVKTHITNDDFIAMNTLERIQAIDALHGNRALQLSSMQKTASVLMHLIWRAKARAVILFVDTQYHFQETLDVRDAFIEKYGLAIKTVYPKMTPEEQERKYQRLLYQFVDGQPECCYQRKEKPYLKAARELKIEATLSGLMRAEGGERRKIQPIGEDPRIPAIVYHPIFDWTPDRVDAYLKEHGVPIHALHARSYPSIGCETCTTPVAPGESPRAGRWRHLRSGEDAQPQYCNINFSDLGEGI